MNLRKNGKLLCDLRKAKGMTQKEVDDKLGIVPKTVSKWETGHGFPDVSTNHGRRSKIASESLAKLGYTNVKEFGGIIDWPYEVVK